MEREAPRRQGSRQGRQGDVRVRHRQELGLAKNLKGHLLLITGDIDNNVHPANTYRVVDALIKANKRFDFIMLPGQRHGYTTDGDYVYWRRVDYFSQWLLGSAPTDVDMVELNREKEIKK